jgi:hypothetical protein
MGEGVKSDRGEIIVKYEVDEDIRVRKWKDNRRIKLERNCQIDNSGLQSRRISTTGEEKCAPN